MRQAGSEADRYKSNRWTVNQKRGPSRAPCGECTTTQCARQAARLLARDRRGAPQGIPQPPCGLLAIQLAWYVPSGGRLLLQLHWVPFQRQVALARLRQRGVADAAGAEAAHASFNAAPRGLACMRLDRSPAIPTQAPLCLPYVTVPGRRPMATAHPDRHAARLQESHAVNMHGSAHAARTCASSRGQWSRMRPSFATSATGTRRRPMTLGLACAAAVDGQGGRRAEQGVQTHRHVAPGGGTSCRAGVAAQWWRCGWCPEQNKAERGGQGRTFCRKGTLREVRASIAPGCSYTTTDSEEAAAGDRRKGVGSRSSQGTGSAELRCAVAQSGRQRGHARTAKPRATRYTANTSAGPASSGRTHPSHSQSPCASCTAGSPRS